MLVAAALASAAVAAAPLQAPPPEAGQAIARAANVVWRSPLWANDGSGALPIGNGDVAAPVWVDPGTGDLRLLLRKSDAFDENSQPVTTGVLRLRFDPPLWTPGPSLCGATNGSAAAALAEFDNATKPGVSTIGDQSSMLPPTDYKCKAAATCAAEMAAVCCGTPGCAAFSVNLPAAAAPQPLPEGAMLSVSAPPWSCKLFNCTCQGLADYYGVVSGSGFGCTPPEAQQWWQSHSCKTKPKTGGNCGGPACKLPGHVPCHAAPKPKPTPPKCMLQMYSETKPWAKTPGPGWSFFANKHAATLPPAPPPPPTPTGPCTATEQFCIELDVPTATVSITTKGYQAKVWVDLDAPLVHGKPDRSAGILHVDVEASKQFGLSVMLEPFRVEGAKTPLGAAFCDPRYEHADTLPSKSGDASLIVYHWNRANDSTYQADTMIQQGMGRPSAALPDLFTHRAFGAKLAGGAGLAAVNATTLVGKGLKQVALTATLLTLAPSDAPMESSWLAAIETVKPATAAAGGRTPSHTSWPALMERSYIELTAAAGASNTTATAAAAKQITDHVVWDRYLSLIQGRAAAAPIKFNGQMFVANQPGKGWDARSWGAGYWWQNERQPYYNTLQQGDLDTMRSFLDFYLRMLPYVNARSKAQFKGLADAPELTGSAALYEETCTQFGTCTPAHCLPLLSAIAPVFFFFPNHYST
jgi:hypothetical protein